MDNYIRNRFGRIIGRFDGNTLRDEQGNIVAIYHEAEDITRDRSGTIIGKGDQRMRLLEG